ncbi:ArsR/SmtB family transcription factor [Nitratireductor basaltis]|uniref:Regulatory protein ArsR n=1 Tax=Nitratireductor basaltis TaxID=472175 RepID=A0A084U5I5_9HYPH|nr:metalloregulator ArsR/SmtB family transcription factor [Nitratireductor basaltis]KFB08221.1 Regulatory protein ArsR [Nitratireductor basaltis]
MELDTAVMQLEALGHPIRLKLYRALVRAGDEGLPVGTIQQKLEIPASTLSHHLKRLDETRLITRERRATTLICRANYTAMNALIGYLVDECCVEGSPPRAITPALTGCG